MNHYDWAAAKLHFEHSFGALKNLSGAVRIKVFNRDKMIVWSDEPSLIDNAVKYGGYARVTASRGKNKVIVQMRDGGPGIPENMLEAVFDPFFRLEASRSRDTGGTGIGITIARNIAEKHGGTLYLHNHPDGGLVATLELPIG